MRSLKIQVVLYTYNYAYIPLGFKLQANLCSGKCLSVRSLFTCMFLNNKVTLKNRTLEEQLNVMFKWFPSAVEET